MNKNYLYIGIVILILLVGSGLYLYAQSAKTTEFTGGTGTPPATSTPEQSTTSPGLPHSPKPTPAPVGKGTVTGVVMLGPTCPVMREPPDPQCADKGYKTTIRVQSANATATSQSISSDASGHFQVSLPAGTYTFSANGGSMLPRCQSQTVTIAGGESKDITLQCDTGIR
jgi:hypothetical protein